MPEELTLAGEINFEGTLKPLKVLSKQEWLNFKQEMLNIKQSMAELEPERLFGTNSEF